MYMFKLTPKPQSDYRLEVGEIKKLCKVERHGYRHNKIVYGFCQTQPRIAKLQHIGLVIEEIECSEAQQDLITALVERGRAKSKIDHLQYDRQAKGDKNEAEEADVQQKLDELNNKIQDAKTALGIEGTVKILKF